MKTKLDIIALEAMSGHSKWSTIKHQKAANDIAKGKLFSKLARAITIAIKTGSGADPESNYKLRMIIDTARAANMPKENIERAISRASSEGANLEAVTYEGFGPLGVNVLVDATTDNRNRTVAEIKKLFERGGGTLGGPGSVSFNFSPKGMLVIKKANDVDSQTLSLIDLGVEDIEDVGGDLEIFVDPSKLSSTKESVEKLGFQVLSAELIQKPKTVKVLGNETDAAKVLNFLDSLEEHDDVQKVFSNIDVPDEILGKL